MNPQATLAPLQWVVLPKLYPSKQKANLATTFQIRQGATGAWISTGDRTVAYTFVALDRDSEGNFKGTFKVRGKVTLNEAYDEFTGGGSVDFFDAQGKIVHSGTFTTCATRINVEAP
jgi:hypothetical protein